MEMIILEKLVFLVEVFPDRFYGIATKSDEFLVIGDFYVHRNKTRLTTHIGRFLLYILPIQQYEVSLNMLKLSPISPFNICEWPFLTIVIHVVIFLQFSFRQQFAWAFDFDAFPFFLNSLKQTLLRGNLFSSADIIIQFLLFVTFFCWDFFFMTKLGKYLR